MVKFECETPTAIEIRTHRRASKLCEVNSSYYLLSTLADDPRGFRELLSGSPKLQGQSIDQRLFRAARDSCLGKDMLTDLLLVSIGGAIGVTGTLLSTILVMRHQSRESRREDRRTLRTERAKRMRKSLVQIIAASYALWDVVIDESMKPTEIDSPEYQERLSRYIDDANQAISELSIELGGMPYLDQFKKLNKHVRMYRQQLDLIRSNEDGASREKLREHQYMASTTLEEIRAQAASELGLLEEPI